MEDANKHDFDLLKKELKFQCYQEIKKKRHEKTWKERSDLIKRRIKQMAMFREDEYKKKCEELENKLNKKESTYLTSLNLINEKKVLDKKYVMEELFRKENEAKQRVEQNLEIQEKQRIKEAERTEKRSK